MVCSSGILTRVKVILAKVETTCGVDAVPTATDGLLVEEPMWTPAMETLTRNNARATLSPEPVTVGKKTGQMTFMHEVRGSGDPAVAPDVGVLLRGCGMSETQITGLGTLGAAVARTGNTGTITWAATTAYDGSDLREVLIECTTGGASGVAEVSITAPALGALPAINITGQVVTDATPISLTGSTDAEYTPTIGTSLVAGDKWNVPLLPEGWQYQPVSDNFESLSLYQFHDGLLYKSIGCMGTYSLDATGGAYGKFSFDFQGTYVAPVDAAIVTPVYQTVTPQQVELAALRVEENDVVTSSLIASKFGIDIANTVSPRSDINESDSFVGFRITDRAPTMTFDPEHELVATYDFYGKAASGAQIDFKARVGTTAGNKVNFHCPNIQLTSPSQSDRDGITAIDITANLASNAGDDELSILFS